MRGVVRRFVPIKRAKMTIEFEDGFKVETVVKNPIGMLKKSGYRVPTHYVEERDVRCMTIDELHEALLMYESGLPWSEVAEVYLVPEDELKTMIRKRDRHAYAVAAIARRCKRDVGLQRLVKSGLSMCAVAERKGVTRSMVQMACKRVENGFYDGIDVD